LWNVGFEMRCLQCLALKGVASFLGAFCLVPVDTAVVDVFHLVLAGTVAVISAFHLVPVVTAADLLSFYLVETAAVVDVFYPVFVEIAAVVASD